MQDDWRWPFQCNDCGRDYPTEGFHYRCPTCGGYFEPAEPVQYSPVAGIGLERYRDTFPLPPLAEFYSLGEGRTPLVSDKLEWGTVHFKCEHLNPTGSFKDRGTSVLISSLKAAGVDEAVEDSSGNAGASFAAYAARAGIRARVFVPEYASGPKRIQIEAYGAELVRIPGPRSETAQAVLREAERGAIYASHAYMPHITTGMATIAFELVEDLGRAPGSVVFPVGQGTLLLGAYRGFRALLAAGLIEAMPALIGVQARACAPLWAAHSGEIEGNEEQDTLAEGIRIVEPLRSKAVLEAVKQTGGAFVAVDEEQIQHGMSELAQRGLLVEPTSAVVWPALELLHSDLPGPVVAVLTGSGFKVSPAIWPTGVGSLVGVAG